MLAAWVDNKKCGEFKSELSNKCGKQFQIVAMKQNLSLESLNNGKINGSYEKDSEPVSFNGLKSFEPGIDKLLDTDLLEIGQRSNLKRRRDEFERTSSFSTVCEDINWPEFSGTAVEFEVQKTSLFTSNFHAINFSDDDLTVLVGEMFLQLSLVEVLLVSWRTVQKFILCVRAAMPNNAYHNWIHVVDVTQTVFRMASDSGVLRLLSGKQRLALFLAALCHDIEHPGVTAGFLLKSNSNMAAWYKHDPGLLEKHHSLRAFELLVSKDLPLLHQLAPEDRANMRHWVRDLILATDMAHHHSIVQQLERELVQQPSSAAAALGSGHDGPAALKLPPPPQGAAGGAGGPSRWLLPLQMLLKCADISNVAKPLPVAMEWAVAVTDEFFAQGDLERVGGMEVTPMCDRNSQSRVQLNKSFVDYVAAPLFRLASGLLPGLKPLLSQLEENRMALDSVLDDDLLSRVEEIRENKRLRYQHRVAAQELADLQIQGMASVACHPVEAVSRHHDFPANVEPPKSQTVMTESDADSDLEDSKDVLKERDVKQVCQPGPSNGYLGSTRLDDMK